MASEYDSLRTVLINAAASGASAQRRIYTADGITVEYSLLTNLTDLLNAAVMLTHTIDQVRTADHAEFPSFTIEQVTGVRTSDDTFLGSTS